MCCRLNTRLHPVRKKSFVGMHCNSGVPLLCYTFQNHTADKLQSRSLSTAQDCRRCTQLTLDENTPLKDSFHNFEILTLNCIFQLDKSRMMMNLSQKIAPHHTMSRQWIPDMKTVPDYT